MGLECGDLIRWCCGHKSYQAFGDVLVGHEPIYLYGVVYKISVKEPLRVIVLTFDGKRHILDAKHDSYEVLSGS